MKNKIFATLLALTLALSLTACGSKSDDSAKADTTDDAQTEQPAEPQETVTLNVAASPTPHAEILKQCVPILAEQGIDLQIHEYSDYVVPNTAVEDGDEDANYFQHVPYLDDFNTTRGTHLVSVTGVHIEPMGIYAGKSDSLDNLPDGASVAVPNDATNEGRALLLLEAQGLIKLADDSNLSSTPKDIVENPKNLTFTDTTVKILSALNDDSKAQIESMANELCKDYLARQDETANKNNLDALFNIGYGLYVVTSSDGSKDNGLIVNTVSQVTNTPNRIAVTINKQNYSHHVIKQTGVMNVCCLDTSAPFSVFQTFGFQSGRTADKFAGIEELRSDNGLRFLPRYINSFMSLKVESYVDLDTHGMFICSVTEARVISDRETMTYTYYQNNVKPKPETEGKHGFVCKVCGWIYEGDTLPDDIVCPLCKHGAADFEPIG